MGSQRQLHRRCREAGRGIVASPGPPKVEDHTVDRLRPGPHPIGAQLSIGASVGRQYQIRPTT
jgi:hypothetical protein